MRDVPVHTHDSSHAVVTQLLDTIKGIRYGSVEIIIHDGKIVQIERKEKLRCEVTLPQRR